LIDSSIAQHKLNKVTPVTPGLDSMDLLVLPGRLTLLVRRGNVFTLRQGLLSLPPRTLQKAQF
jgi:hypothetical protein